MEPTDATLPETKPPAVWPVADPNQVLPWQHVLGYLLAGSFGLIMLTILSIKLAEMEKKNAPEHHEHHSSGNLPCFSS